MSEEIIERMGQLIDKCDNFLTYPDNKFMPLPMRADAMGHGLKEIRAELLAIYLAAGGTDEWSERDGEE